jgi:hypothetical protein
MFNANISNISAISNIMAWTNFVIKLDTYKILRNKTYLSVKQSDYNLSSSLRKWQNTFHQVVEIFRKTFWKIRVVDSLQILDLIA